MDNLFGGIRHLVDLIAVERFVGVILLAIGSRKWPVDTRRSKNKLNGPQHPANLGFNGRFVFGIKVMDFDGQNPAGNVSAAQLNVPTKAVTVSQCIECTKLMLPGKGLWITEGL